MMHRSWPVSILPTPILVALALLGLVLFAGCTSFQGADGTLDLAKFEKAVQIAKESGLQAEIDLRLEPVQVGLLETVVVDSGIRAEIRLRHSGDKAGPEQ